MQVPFDFDPGRPPAPLKYVSLCLQNAGPLRLRSGQAFDSAEERFAVFAKRRSFDSAEERFAQDDWVFEIGAIHSSRNPTRRVIKMLL